MYPEFHPSRFGTASVSHEEGAVATVLALHLQETFHALMFLLGQLTKKKWPMPSEATSLRLK